MCRIWLELAGSLKLKVTRFHGDAAGRQLREGFIADNMAPERPPFSAEEFFLSQAPPPRLEQHLDAVRSFVERNVRGGRRVVLVTVSNVSLCNWSRTLDLPEGGRTDQIFG